MSYACLNVYITHTCLSVMMTECVFTNNSFAETWESIAITSDCGCVFKSVKSVQNRQWA